MSHRAIIVTIVAALGLLASAPPAGAHSQRDWREQRSHVRSRALSQRGAPYRSGGTSPSGFDCSGFTRWVFLEHGASLPHSSSKQYALAARDGNKRIWSRRNLEVGDLVFHKTTSARVGHAGLYIGDGRFISSTSSGGVRVESLYDPYYWGSRWVGGTRLATTVRYTQSGGSTGRSGSENGQVPLHLER